MNKFALSLVVFVNFIYEKLSGPIRFVVTVDTKIILSLVLSKYVTQEEIDDFTFRYRDIDFASNPKSVLKESGVDTNLKKLLKSKQTDQILKFMQDNNISVECKLIYGTTPIMYSSFFDDENTTKEFIKLGANIRQKDNFGLSPLAYAIENNSTKTAKLLLDSGVKFKAVQWYRKTPFYYNIGKLIIDEDDVKIIFEDNYQVNKESKDVNDPIGYVVTHNYVEMTELALASGYKPRLRNRPSSFPGIRDDSSPFMYSYYAMLDTIPNYEPMLELLLKHGVIGQPTKEELKKAYEECYDEYALSIILAYSIDDNGTYSLKYENLTKNALQKYCSEKNSTFSDVRTFITWANEYKKADAIQGILLRKKDKIIFRDNATQYIIKPYKKLTSDEIKAIVESR